MTLSTFSYHQGELVSPLTLLDTLSSDAEWHLQKADQSLRSAALVSEIMSASLGGTNYQQHSFFSA